VLGARAWRAGSALDVPRGGMRCPHVVLMVSLTSQRQETLEAFERAVTELDDVLECPLVAGESDYLPQGRRRRP
jgi:DNA-binding Lrp family transcriptional regulator